MKNGTEALESSSQDSLPQGFVERSITFLCMCVESENSLKFMVNCGDPALLFHFAHNSQVRDLIAFKNHYDLTGPVLLADGLLAPAVSESLFFARLVPSPNLGTQLTVTACRF